jgi:hypothetical protein
MEKPIITKSYWCDRWYFAVWYKGLRRGLYDTKQEAQLKVKEYETGISTHNQVGQQQGAN